MPESSSILDDLPSQYQDLQEAFSKQCATRLPPQRSYDCTMDLLPGATPAKGKVFLLSQPETGAMQVYIQEELKKGFILSSMPPPPSPVPTRQLLVGKCCYPLQ